MKATVCIGVDLGDRFSHAILLDPQTGEILEDSRIPTTEVGFRKYFDHREPGRVAIEVGTHSPWVDRLLKSLGHEVFVANPTKLRLITKSDSKTDRADAHYLAELAAANPRLLHPIKHRSADVQADRAVIKARDQLVSSQTDLINCTRGLVKSTGARLPKCTSGSFHHKVQEAIPEALRPALQPILKTLAEIHSQLLAFDKEIRVLSRKHKVTTALQQVSGVGPITALNYVLTLEDPGRFKSSRQVGSYIGLRPASRSSGKSQPELRITKAGDPMLRKHLVNCAQYILGPFGQDSDLRRFGLKLAARGDKVAKRKAVVAVARKLSVLLHALWISGAEYEPLLNAFRQGEAPSSWPQPPSGARAAAKKMKPLSSSQGSKEK